MAHIADSLRHHVLPVLHAGILEAPSSLLRALHDAQRLEDQTLGHSHLRPLAVERLQHWLREFDALLIELRLRHQALLIGILDEVASGRMWQPQLCQSLGCQRHLRARTHEHELRKKRPQGRKAKLVANGYGET